MQSICVMLNTHIDHIEVLFFHHIPVHFTPTNTQKLVHAEDKTPRHKQSNVVYALQYSQDYTHLYIGESRQPLQLPTILRSLRDSFKRDGKGNLF